MSASCEATPSRIAASTTWPEPGPLPLHERRQNADYQESAAAAHIADDVERRHRRAFLRPDGLKRARQREEGEIVARGVCERALLPPAGHAPIDQLRIPCECRVRPQAKPLHDARPEALDENVRLLR